MPLEKPPEPPEGLGEQIERLDRLTFPRPEDVPAMRAALRRETALWLVASGNSYSDETVAKALSLIEDVVFDPVRARRWIASSGSHTRPRVETRVRDAVIELLTDFSGLRGEFYKSFPPEFVNDHRMDETLTRVLDATPFFGVLRSFFDPLPEPKDERKRTAQEVQIAVANKEQELRRINGISPSASLRMYPNVAQQLQRATNAIEEEVVRGGAKRAPVGRSPLQRAADYLLSLLPPQEAASLRTDLGLHNIGPNRTSAELEHLDWRVWEVGLPAGQKDALSEVCGQSFSKIAREILHAVYGGEGANNVAFERRIIGPSLRYKVLNVDDSCRGAPGGYYYALNRLDRAVITGMRHSVFDQVHRPWESSAWHRFKVEPPGASESVVEDLELARDELPLGRVLSRNDPPGVPHKLRILRGMQEFKNQLPEGSPVAGHLVINVVGWKGVVASGYILEQIRQDGATVLRYDPNDDPYCECTIRLPEEGVRKLISAYDDAGLDSLSEALRGQAGDLRVADLERILADNSVYDGSSEKPRRVYAGSIMDLALAYLQDGVLKLQCTGAAQLLKLSLHEAFGDKGARVIKGLAVVPGDDRIGPIGHAQVLFPHEGRVYFLDSTPAGPIDLGGGMRDTNERFAMDSGSRERRRLTDYFRRWRESERPSAPSPPMVDSARLDMLIEQKAAGANVAQPDIDSSGSRATRSAFTLVDAKREVVLIRDNELLPLLRAWLPEAAAKGKDNLYKALLARGQGDPLWRVLGATHRVVADNMTREELARLQKFLQDVKVAKPSNPVFRSIPRYSQRQLEPMINIVDRIVATLDRINT